VSPYDNCAIAHFSYANIIRPVRGLVNILRNIFAQMLEKDMFFPFLTAFNKPESVQSGINSSVFSAKKI